MLDLQTFKWENVEPESDEFIPKAREYAAMFYQNNNLIVFGGWNSGWLNDMYGYNVSKVVGPPYAITSIEPNLGQLSGGDTVIIHGQGFSDPCSVYFTCGSQPVAEPHAKLSLKANNVRVNADGTVECETPNYTELAPKFECIVQVMCGSSDLTTTWQKYTFFANTRAARSLCYGSGILNDQQINETSTFIIQARNENCENRTSGRDKFEVTVTHEDTKQEIPS